jgi:phosphoribosyl-ATP pyrophosphohydrolase
MTSILPEAIHESGRLTSLYTNFRKVKEFCKAFGHMIQEEPNWPDTDTVRLRINLIREEAAETIHALMEQDVPDIAKELADLLYVTYGTAVAFGIPMDKVFDEVHRSNMSKLEDGKPVYRADGKVLKGKDYKSANIEKVLGWKS